VLNAKPLFHVRQWKWMRNSDYILFQKESPINLDEFRGMLEGHSAAGAEQDLQFLQTRPDGSVSNEMANPFNVNSDISSHHLPRISYGLTSQERYWLLNRSHSKVPFNINLNLPKDILEEHHSLCI
jgi:hypothetical protein